MNPIIAKVLEWLLGLLKKPVFWLCVALAIAVAILSIQHKKLAQAKEEAARYEENQTALLSDMEKYRTENGELVASVNALSLKAEELGVLIPKYEKEIKQLKIDLRNAKNIAHVSTETSVGIIAPLGPETPPETISPGKDEPQDTIPKDEPPMARDFSWSDDWITVQGKVYPDTVVCTFVSRDSLMLVAHYAKKNCIFKRWRKGKLIKYDVKTKNPHTDIKGVEYIEVIE